jgi:hypothetical protein
MSAEKAMNMHKKVHALQSKLSYAAKQSLDRKFGAFNERKRIFLKRKYSDRSRAGWRIAGNLPIKLGLAQFG